MTKLNQKQNGKKDRFIPPYLLALLDAFWINAGLFLAFQLRFKGNVPDYNIEPFWDIAPWLGIATIVIFSGLGLYERRRNGYMSVLRAVLTGVTGIFLITLALSFWLRGFAFPRSVLLLSVILQALLISLWRYACWYLEKKMHGRRSLLIIGSGEEKEKLLEQVIDLPRGWFQVRQVLDYASIEQLDKWLGQVDAVLLAPTITREQRSRLLTDCRRAGCDVFWVPDFYDILMLNARLEQLSDLPVMEVKEIGLTALQRSIKRILDVALALLALVITAPITVLCPIFIRLSSPGPTFYAQQRVGRGQRIFRLLKFRTMVEDAERETGPVFAMDNDPRITGIGKFLRSTRLDELPQLINVLKGEMSIVGPRPERSVFVDEFGQIYPEYHYRHVVKPGMTGFAQVVGKYTTSPEDKLKFDLYYIRNYSLLLDLKIILQTIPVLFTRESANGIKHGAGNLHHRAPETW